MKSETTSPCDADDSVSAGTMFFARSNDSLVMPRELIDVDHFDADKALNVTNSTTEIDLPTNTIRLVAVQKRLEAVCRRC